MRKKPKKQNPKGWCAHQWGKAEHIMFYKCNGKLFTYKETVAEIPGYNEQTQSEVNQMSMDI